MKNYKIERTLLVSMWLLLMSSYLIMIIWDHLFVDIILVILLLFTILLPIYSAIKYGWQYFNKVKKNNLNTVASTIIIVFFPILFIGDDFSRFMNIPLFFYVDVFMILINIAFLPFDLFKIIK
jgi:hypothetical protein